MFNLKTLTILMLSAHLALAATVANVVEPTIRETIFPQTDDITDAGNGNFSLAAECSAQSSNAGLGRLLREATYLQPWQQIQQLIIDSVFNDKQVYDFVIQQHSDAMYTPISKIHQSAEYNILREYICQQMNLDITKLWNFVESFISVTKETATPSFNEFTGRPGTYGLMQDIYDILPHQQLEAMYQQLLVQDPLLSTAVERMKSSEYRQLLRNVHLLPESLALRKQLVNAGVPLLELRQLVNVALGWDENYFGDVGADLSV